MAYKIEDIDWSRMPEGAVEFMLEDCAFPLTWLNSEGQKWSKHVEFWDDQPYTGGRSRYKVADHHPDMKQAKWDGDGLPPVGTVCEAEDFEVKWIKGEVIYHDKKEGVAVLKTERGYNGYSVFRPIRSERDEWVEKVGELLSISHTNATREWVGVVYDALKSGKLEAVKHEP